MGHLHSNHWCGEKCNQCNVVALAGAVILQALYNASRLTTFPTNKSCIRHVMCMEVQGF
jgi:hypothetical protein